MTPDEDRLFQHLPKGRLHARTQARLAELCGWHTASLGADTRRVQRVSESLRAQGICVASACAPPRGAYIAVSPDEVGAYKAQLFARIKATLKTVRQIDSAWEAELADELFHPCKNCGRVIPRETEYCDAPCRNEFHTRARVAGYSVLGVA